MKLCDIEAIFLLFLRMQIKNYGWHLSLSLKRLGVSRGQHKSFDHNALSNALIIFINQTQCCLSPHFIPIKKKKTFLLKKFCISIPKDPWTVIFIIYIYLSNEVLYYYVWMLNMKFKLQTNKRMKFQIIFHALFISQDAKDIIALFMTQLEKWVGLHLLL